MQIVLQATHGIVSGAPDFFKHAFGDTFEDYARILMMPHDFIFNRTWYERYDQDNKLYEFQAEFGSLDNYERAELMELLSSRDPREFVTLSDFAANDKVRRILRFYIPVSKDELTTIWATQKELVRLEAMSDLGLAEDERVEDAGLDYEEESIAITAELAPKQRAVA
jgi:hypothetical protein